jgi:hypothetical protein
MVLRSVRFGVRSQKLIKVGQSLGGLPKIYYLELLRASEGTLNRWSRLQPLALTNPHWACLVGYGPFSLCVIHKVSLCPSRADIKSLMTIAMNLRSIIKLNKVSNASKGAYRLCNMVYTLCFITRPHHVTLLFNIAT